MQVAIPTTHFPQSSYVFPKYYVFSYNPAAISVSKHRHRPITITASA